MKHGILALPLGLSLGLGLILGLSACNKKEKAGGGPEASSAAIPATPPVDGPLVLTAELEEIPGPFPANDIYNYCYIMKYKVLKVVKGEYADKDILVGHYNPRIARSEVKDDQDAKVGGGLKGYKVGDVHYLVLTDLDGAWNGALEDEYYKDRRHRYWALWADKL
jgi:hypothetical protein